MNEKLKNILSFVSRIAISGIILWFIFSKIDMSQTIPVLKSADVKYLVWAGGAFLFINGIILFRWFIYIKALNLTASVGNIIKYYFFGLFGNLFLPSAIGGDIIKILGLCKDSSQKPRVVASVLLDRLSGFAAIVLVEVGVLLFGQSFVLEDKTLLIPIVVMGFGLVGLAAFLFNERIYSFGCKIFNKLPKIKNALMQLHYDIALLKDKKVYGFLAIGISCFSQMMFAYCWFLTSKAFHCDVSLIYFIVFVPMLCVAASTPSIGGLGVREAGAVYLFAKIGMDSGIAVSVSLVTYLFMVCVGLIGGVIYVASLFAGRLQHQSSDGPIRPSQL